MNAEKRHGDFQSSEALTRHFEFMFKLYPSQKLQLGQF
jgi:hypothetical protein